MTSSYGEAASFHQIADLAIAATEIDQLARLDDLWTTYLTAEQGPDLGLVDLPGLDFLSGRMAVALPRVDGAAGTVVQAIC